MMRTFREVTELRYANAAQTLIECVVKFDEFDAPVPFAATLGDVESHSAEIFWLATQGAFGKIAEYVEPEPEPAQQSELQKLRAEIDGLKGALVRKGTLTEEEIKPMAMRARQ